MAAPTPGTEQYSYYVSASGSNTAPYDTWAKGAHALVTILNLMKNAGANQRAEADTKCIYVAPGTYAVTISPDNVRESNTTFVGATGSSPGDASENVKGTVIIAPTSDAAFYLSTPSVAHDFMFKNCTMLHPATKRGLYLCEGLVLDNVDLTAAASTSIASINSNQAVTSFLIKRTRIRAGVANPIYIGNHAVSGNIEMSIIESMIGANSTLASTFDGTGTINIKRTSFLNSQAEALKQTRTGIVNIYDSVLASGVNGGNIATISNAGGGQINAYNNMILGRKLATIVSGLTTDSGNIINVDPKFVGLARPGFVIPCVDETWPSAVALDSALGARGLKLTFCLWVSPWNSGDNAAVRTALANGNIEIASHSFSHPSATATTLGILTSSSGTNPSYKLDLTAHTFSVKTDETTWDCVIDIGVNNDKNFTAIIAEIRTATSNHWNITYDTFNSIAMTGNVKAFACNDTAGYIAIATHIALNLSGYTVGFYKEEITDPKAYIADTIVNGAGNITDPQTGTTYVCNSYVAPGDRYDANYAAALKAAGFWGQRCGAVTFGNVGNQDLFQINYIAIENLIGANDDDTKGTVRGLCFVAAASGVPIAIVAHTESLATWTPILDALQECNNSGLATVTSLQLVLQALRNSPWTYNGTTGISTRTFNYNNYSLRPSSPGINAGVSTGVTIDFDGKATPQGGAPDIGPYEYNSSGSWFGG
jgi:hypothetical protein